jgi:hypothetical protein
MGLVRKIGRDGTRAAEIRAGLLTYQEPFHD